MRSLTRVLYVTLFGAASFNGVGAQPKNFGTGANLAVAGSDGENTVVMSGSVVFDRFTTSVLTHDSDLEEIYTATADAMGVVLSRNGFDQSVARLPSIGGGFSMQQSFPNLIANRSLGLDSPSLTMAVKNASTLLAFYSMVMNSSQLTNFTAEVGERVSPLVQDLTQKSWHDIEVGGMMFPIFLFTGLISCVAYYVCKEKREEKMRDAEREGAHALLHQEGAEGEVNEDMEGHPAGAVNEAIELMAAEPGAAPAA